MGDVDDPDRPWRRPADGRAASTDGRHVAGHDEEAAGRGADERDPDPDDADAPWRRPDTTVPMSRAPSAVDRPSSAAGPVAGRKAPPLDDVDTTRTDTDDHAVEDGALDDGVIDDRVIDDGAIDADAVEHPASERWSSRRAAVGSDGASEPPPGGRAGPLPPVDVTVERDAAVAGARGALGPDTAWRQAFATSLAVALVLACAAVVGILVRPSNEAVRIDLAAELPLAGTPRWTVTPDHLVDAVAIGDGVVVTASDAGPVVAYEIDTGVARWRVDVGPSRAIESLAVIDGVAVVTDSQFGVQARLHALDVVTGELRWLEDTSGTTYWAYDRWVYRVTSRANRRILQFLDPVTGQPVGAPVQRTMDFPLVSGPFVARFGGEDIDLLDLDTLEPVATGIGRDSLRWVSAIGDDHVVALDDSGDVVAFDADGVEVDRVSLDVGTGRADIAGPVPGHPIVVVAGDRSFGIEVESDTIDVVWQVAGRAGQPVGTDVGAVSVARLVDPEDGTATEVIVDAVDGSRLLTTNVGAAREGSAVAGRNGVVIPPELGELDRTLRAVGYGGDELWAVPLTFAASEYEVGGGVLAIVERRNGGRSVLRVYG